MKKVKIFIVLIVIILLLLILSFGIIHIIKSKERAKNEKLIGNLSEAFSQVIENGNYSYNEESIIRGSTSSNIKKIVKDNKIVLEQGNNTFIYADTSTNEVYQVNKEEKTYTKFDDKVKDSMMQVAKAFTNMPYINTAFSLKENYESYNLLINNMKVTDDVYQETDCYKISYDMSKIGLTDAVNHTWYNKETLLPVREVLEDYNGNVLEEHNYLITSGDITDKDVSFESFSDYTLIEN